MPKNDSLFAGVANNSDDAQARTTIQSSDFELDGENDDTGEDICTSAFFLHVALVTIMTLLEGVKQLVAKTLVYGRYVIRSTGALSLT